MVICACVCYEYQSQCCRLCCSCHAASLCASRAASLCASIAVFLTAVRCRLRNRVRAADGLPIQTKRHFAPSVRNVHRMGNAGLHGNVILPLRILCHRHSLIICQLVSTKALMSRRISRICKLLCNQLRID